MKPNSEKSGDLFVTPMMLEQLRYSGLLEVCTIRKMGECVFFSLRLFLSWFDALTGISFFCVLIY